ncbi:MAG TPA: phosphoribosyltransferase family protein, partial [Pyrinomonadaceae bacterium]|nr:phosphoribosyltransferase family protein [Pyrinomonadaceae bacterium]
ISDCWSNGLRKPSELMYAAPNRKQENPMVQLIPSQDAVMQILKRTGAFREGHFIYPNGKHSPHYFQMPLAFRYYDTARVLAVALSRKFRLEKDISSQLPKVAVISPSSGGIPVAFGVRDALNAEQIYWAEQETGKRMFRQYVNQGEINPCIIVDDIIRSGNAIQETVDLVKSLGARVIGCGAIVRFDTAANEIEGGPVRSLIDFDVRMYDSEQQCPECKAGVTSETVRF